MSIDLKRLTYDVYLAMPEMKQRYSILDGELVMAAAPNPSHQTIVQELLLKLTPFVRERQLGRVFVAPLTWSFGVNRCGPVNPTLCSLDRSGVLSSAPRSLKERLTS